MNLGVKVRFHLYMIEGRNQPEPHRLCFDCRELVIVRVFRLGVLLLGPVLIPDSVKFYIIQVHGLNFFLLF